jgi:hypothetical protein
LRILFLAMLLPVFLAGWLLAAPPGASPDDGFHLASVWCGAGFRDGVCLEDVASPDPSRALVPRSVLSITCFQYDASRSAACTLTQPPEDAQRFVRVESNLSGERPNLYYRTMHRLIGDGTDVAGAAGRIRVANLLVVASMVLMTASVAQRRLRAAFLLTWFVASVPLGLFLMTSLNTSAWGLAGLGTLWANAITLMHHSVRWKRVAAGALVAIGLMLALGSRTEAVAHVGITAAVIAALWWWDPAHRETRSGRRLDLRVTLSALGVALLAAVTILLVAPENARLAGLFNDIRTGHARIAARNVGDPLLAIAFEVPSLWAGALGHIWGLGALDTPIPVLASIPLISIYVLLLGIGLQHAARARVLAATFVGVTLFVIPTFSLMRVGLLVYEGLQPRQFMALLFLLLGTALFRYTSEPELQFGRAMRATLVAGLGIAHSVALLVTIRRHTSGLLPGFLGDFQHVSFKSEIEWWWASIPHPDVVWIIASLAYTAAAFVVVGMFRPTEDDDRPRLAGSLKPPAGRR